MLLFWNNGFLRPLIQLGIWLFGNNENEFLTLDNEGERRVDAYGSEGSPFARLAPDLHDGGRTARLEAGVARRVGRRKERANTGVVTRDDDRCDDEGSCGCGVTYLCSCTLHLILEYWLESAPLPLAVAAAGPRLRLAGEQTGVFYFPGAASCVRATAVLPVATSAAGGSSGGAAAAGSTGVYIAPPLPESSIVLRQHGRCSGGALCSPTTRHVRGTSLMSLSHAMPHSAWWYGRDTPAAHYHCHAVLGTAAATGDGGDAACEAEGRDVTSDGAVDASRRLCACLPLSVEVVAPRIAVPAAAAPTKDAVGATASVPACLWRWLRQPFFALFVGGTSCEGREERAPALSVDAETQRAALQFVALLDQLWCQRRCALVELTTLAEGCLPDAVVDCSQQWPASEPDVVRADSLQSLKKLCAALTGKALGKDKCVVMSDWGGCHGAVSPLQMEYGAEDAEASCDACAAILRGGGFLRHGELANSGGDWAHVGCTVECSHGPRLPRGAGLLHGHRGKRSR